jgi:hypothetical protein
MQVPSEFPTAQAMGYRSRFVLRARNRVVAFFRGLASYRPERLSKRLRLLLLSVVLTGIIGGGIVVGFITSRAGASPATGQESPYWEAISHVDLKNLTTIGKNRYFNLEPGYRLRYTNGDGTLTITVRRKIKVIDGIQTRVVEEKESRHGQPTKVVWRYYAIDKTTSALYCFGVHNQTYYQGHRLSHRGWRSGAGGATFTLVLPAAPKPGDTMLRNHSLNASRRQEDVIDVAQKVITPAGTFTDCVCTESKGGRESKVKAFAPGVGMVQDGQFALVKVVQTVARKKDEAKVR